MSLISTNTVITDEIYRDLWIWRELYYPVTPRQIEATNMLKQAMIDKDAVEVIFALVKSSILSSYRFQNRPCKTDNLRRKGMRMAQFLITLLEEQGMWQDFHQSRFEQTIAECNQFLRRTWRSETRMKTMQYA